MARAPRVPQGSLTALALGAVVAVPSTFGLLISRQVRRIRANAMLPRPDYTVDITVQPPWVQGEPLRVTFLGDSLVEGVGAPRASQSLPAQTAYRLAAHLGRPIRMRSHGIASSKVDDVIREQVPELDHDTDLVIVLIGANDATGGTPPWEFARRIEALTVQAHERTGGAPVVFTGLPPVGSAPLLTMPLREIASAMGDTLHTIQRRLAQRLPQARYIDIRCEVGDTLRRRGKELFAADHYHPNPAGYALLGEAVARSLTAMLHDERPVQAATFTQAEMDAIHRAAWEELAALPGITEEDAPPAPPAVASAA